MIYKKKDLMYLRVKVFYPSEILPLLFDKGSNSESSVTVAWNEMERYRWLWIWPLNFVLKPAVAGINHNYLIVLINLTLSHKNINKE